MSRDVFITKVAAFLPNEPVSNDEIETVLGRVNDRYSRARKIVLRNNGIQSRHYVIDKNTGLPRYNNAQLTAETVRALLDDDLALNAIECLCCGTTTPDQIAPSHAAMVHGELGNPPCEIVSTMGICASSVAALKYGYMNILSGYSNNAVVTGSEVASLHLRASAYASSNAQAEDPEQALSRQPELAFEKDFLRWMLSDGAGAMLLERQPAVGRLSLRIDWIELVSFASQQETCMYAGANKDGEGNVTGWGEYALQELIAQDVLALKQDVKLLNQHIVSLTVERALAMISDKRRLKPDDIDYFLPHMSSEYFRDKLAQGLNNIGFSVPQEKWFTNLTRKGNTGAASMFIMLEELFNSGRLQSGQKLLCFVPESGRFTSTFTLLSVV